MVYLTGDTHADFTRFSTRRFPAQKDMTRKDVVIVLGDFGGVWMQHETPEEKYKLDWLDSKSFTLCFVDGNHENYDRLYSDEYPIVDFHGGKAHQLREHVFHLMRGHIFEFDGKDFFVMGGASSHDISDGILDPDEYPEVAMFEDEYWRWYRGGKMFRVNHVSWWKQELPSEEGMVFAEKTLHEHDFAVDYVLAHCLPRNVSAMLGYTDSDSLTMFFDQLVESGLVFSHWHCGHYHTTTDILGKYHVHYEDFERIL